MSLYKFIESSIEENPDLVNINYTNPIDYSSFYNHYRFRERRFEIEAFLDPLFFNNLVRCSVTLKEFDELKFKVRQIAQVSQKLFNLTLLNDKLEKESYSDLIKQKI